MPAAWVAGAAAIVGAVSSYEGAQAQQDASDHATDTQQHMYDQTREDNMPALGARNDALARLEELLGVGGNRGAAGYGSLSGPIDVGDVTHEPGYQSGLQQGQKALENQLAARGMRDSGAGLKEGIRYAADYATTKYNDAFNREQANRQLQINPFQSLAGLGQTGASTMAQAGANAADHIGDLQVGAGNAAAARDIAIGNQLANADNQYADWYMNNRPPANQGQYYQASNGTWYANNDLSGTNRGSGD